MLVEGESGVVGTSLAAGEVAVSLEQAFCSHNFSY